MNRFAPTPLMMKLVADATCFEDGLQKLVLLTGEDSQSVREVVLQRGRQSAASVLTVLERYIRYAQATGELLPNGDGGAGGTSKGG